MILPVVDDRETGPFFAAAREKRLVYAACEHCGRGSHPPTPFCSYCHEPRSEWRNSSGRGTLHSFTTVTHAVHRDYPVPYTLLLVSLDDNPDIQLMGRIDGAASVAVGDAMELMFDEGPDGVVLPNWRPAG
jgi:uncharacterized protein